MQTATVNTSARAVRAPASPQASALDELALAARGGDARALHRLLAQLAARVRPLVRHKIHVLGAGVLSVDDTDDVVQEVVLAAWRFDVQRFRPALGSFATFLSRRLAWHVLDAVRQRGRHVHDALDTLDDCAPEGAAASDPDTLLAAAALEGALSMLVPQLELALRDLDDDERYLVQRHDLEGARLADIAAELGRNTSNACRARQRALKHLSKKLEALAA